MSKPGHLVGTTSEEFGATLTADVAVGDTVLQVDDTGDFDEQVGGFLLLGGSKLAYLPWDNPDNDTDDDGDDDGPLELTLAAASPVAADEGDRVLVFDPSTGEDDPVTDLIALVTIDDRSPGSALKARIRAGLEDQLDSDFDTYIGKAVELEIDAGELVLVGISGSKRTGRYRWFQDYATVPASGDVKIRLTYVPVPNSSVKVSGPGIGLNRDEWDFDPDDPWTIIVPRQSHFHADDEFEAHYAWTDPTPRPTVPGSAILIGSTILSDNATTVDLPADTEAGDLLCLIMSSGGLAGTHPTCSDPRISVQTSPEAHVFLGYGYATSSTDPVAVSVSDGENNGAVVLAAYRVTGTIADASSSGTTTFAPDLPPGSPDAVILLDVRGGAGGTGGGGITSPQGDWVKDAEAIHSGSTAEVWSNSDPADLSVSPPALTGWYALTIGLLEG